ncbi:MAG: hypothetical protein JW892_13255 [Anaerolineae bacterium]|nr:hypothetical protein [Anaerolineae bacterium]
MRRRFILAVLLVAFGAFPSASAAALEPATLRLVPAAGTYQMGDTVTVELWLHDAVALYGVDIRVGFDPDMAQGVGTLMPDTSFFAPDMVLFADVDNDIGEFRYAATKVNPGVPVSGTGRLFTVELQLRRPGSVAVSVLPISQLSTRDAELIPYVVANALYTVEGVEIFLPLVVSEY